MFDTYVVGKHTHGIKNNSVAGTLIKSTNASKIIRFNQGSALAKTFFALGRPYYEEINQPYNTVYVTVLQVMLCGEKEFMVEYIEEKEDK